MALALMKGSILSATTDNKRFLRFRKSVQLTYQSIYLLFTFVSVNLGRESFYDQLAQFVI